MDGDEFSSIDLAPQAHPRLTDLRVLMVALAGYCIFLNVYATQTLLPYLTGVFAASKFQVSLTISATAGGIALGAPFAGLVGERFGRRQTMTTSLALLTLPVILAGTSPSLHVLIAWRFVQGLLMPGVIAVALAYISEEWSAGGAAVVMTAYVAGNVLGGVTGRFLSGVIADHLGWRMVFAVLGCLNAVGAAAVWRWMAPSHLHRHGAKFATVLENMAAQLRRPHMLATFVVGFLMLFALVATFSYVTFYLAAGPFNLDPTALGSIFAVYLVGVIVTPVCGRWIEHFGHRAALTAAALIAAAGVLLTLWHFLPAVLLGLTICSSAVFVCQGAAASYLGHIAPAADRSSAAGLYTMFYYVGGTCGAAVPAFAWKLGAWPACVALVVALLMIDAAIAAVSWRTTATAGKLVD